MVSNHRVLVVDDDLMNIDILEEVLDGRYILETITDSRRVFEVLPSFRPDLILLDIMMPEIDGYEICKKIRENKEYNFIKIILVSGKAMIQERLKGYAAGADDYITKPFVPQELLAKVEVFLRLKRVEEMDKIKDDLLRLFSQETSTPLHAIISLAELHIDEGEWSNALNEDLKIISDNAINLMELLKKTILISDLKGMKTLETEPLDIAVNIERIINRFDFDINRKKLSVNIQKPEHLEIQANWDMFDKAVSNVIDNAIKYSRDDDEIQISMYEQNSVVHLDIADNGYGIHPEKINKVFDEFATKDFLNPDGQGLSLAITKLIVEKHGGKVHVLSELGKGTKINIQIRKHEEVDLL